MLTEWPMRSTKFPKAIFSCSERLQRNRPVPRRSLRDQCTCASVGTGANSEGETVSVDVMSTWSPLRRIHVALW